MSWDTFINTDFNDMSTEQLRHWEWLGALQGVNLGLTQTATATALRDAGMSFSNERFSALWNRVYNDDYGFRYYRTIPVNELPNLNIIPYREYLNGNYRYVGSYDIFDADGKFLKRETNAITRSYLMTRAEALAELQADSILNYGVQQPETRNYRVEGMLQGIDSSNY